MSNDTSDNYVEMWKTFIQNLEAARGNGTSMISLIIKPGDQINKFKKMLANENIKSRMNRLSVLSAIISTQQRLKLYNHLPGNGLVVYCGTIITEEGKEKKVNIYFEPFRPVNTSLCLCDNKFHTEALSALLEDNSKFGFIVVDGNGALFGTLADNTGEVIHKFSVDLQKKDGGGCQPTLSCAHLILENRHNYVRKVSKTAVQLFITDGKVNVEGLVLAGSADFKNELCKSDMFDQRLQAKVLKRVDVPYGAEQGFNQAIELSADCLTNAKFIHEKNIIKSCIDEINQRMEEIPYNFHNDLDSISSDIQSLQKKSLHMHQCLQNRQRMEEILYNFHIDLNSISSDIQSLQKKSLQMPQCLLNRQEPPRNQQIGLREENSMLLADTPELLQLRLKAADRKRKACSTRDESVDESHSKTDADDDINPKKDEGEIKDDENGAKRIKTVKKQGQGAIQKNPLKDRSNMIE